MLEIQLWINTGVFSGEKRAKILLLVPLLTAPGKLLKIERETAYKIKSLFPQKHSRPTCSERQQVTIHSGIGHLPGLAKGQGKQA